MLKLYMVLTFFADVVAVIGPLPYDNEKWCRENLPFMATLEKAWADKLPLMHEGKPLTRADVTAECVWSATKIEPKGPWTRLGK